MQAKAGRAQITARKYSGRQSVLIISLGMKYQALPKLVVGAFS